MKSKIGKLIEEKGYKKKFIAKELGVSATQLSNWISGRNFPSVDKALKIADLLGCNVEDLYERGNEHE